MDRTNKTARHCPSSDELDILGPQWGTARFDQHCRLALRFTKTKSVFSIDVHRSGPVIVGRSGRRDDAPPAVDLASLNAGKLGVSRRHARIEVRDNILRLTDLSSTNGTLVNGVPLKPNVPALIRDGDEIVFGDLKCQVFFVKQTAD